MQVSEKQRWKEDEIGRKYFRPMVYLPNFFSEIDGSNVLPWEPHYEIINDVKKVYKRRGGLRHAW